MIRVEEVLATAIVRSPEQASRQNPEGLIAWYLMPAGDELAWFDPAGARADNERYESAAEAKAAMVAFYRSWEPAARVVIVDEFMAEAELPMAPERAA